MMNKNSNSIELESLLKSTFFRKKLEQTITDKPEKFSFPDEINEKIFSNMIRKLVIGQRNFEESIEGGSFEKLCEHAIIVSKIGLNRFSKMLGVTKEQLKRFTDGRISLLDIGPNFTANILDFFSISVKSLIRKLSEAKDFDGFPPFVYASHSRLYGGKKKLYKPKSSLQPFRKIDKFLEVVRMELELKGRNDLL